ncbi:hypothetical protein KC343_g2166 [Hortaea werneckii]|nr:hypothetical protein KC343_g2166 [Hortaea werneckii]KAI7681120.1 hypothetical protein KC319_g1765 [Hortaea werneckii]KAI7717366.1 hypothetical protein KC322_g2449 [Hortaea werneckii]
MSGYVKGETRPPLPATRTWTSALQDYRFQIGAHEATMNHAVLDAHSQRHTFLGGVALVQQGHNHAAGNNNGFQPGPRGDASPFVRGRGHDPYGFFAKAEEAKRRRAAKKARVLARREVGRLRRWEEWRRGVWEPLVPDA